ncbi:MAG: hypothetical protein N3D84_00715 [Candidatus Woesearchaeota archaeon]|nr:hypothetical protein [Candidatus Woesearchaeota archaeon]
MGSGNKIEVMVGRFFHSNVSIEGHDVKSCGKIPVFGPSGTHAFVLVTDEKRYLYVKPSEEVELYMKPKEGISEEEINKLPTLELVGGHLFNEIPDVLTIDGIPYVWRSSIEDKKLEVYSLDEIMTTGVEEELENYKGKIEELEKTVDILNKELNKVRSVNELVEEFIKEKKELEKGKYSENESLNLAEKYDALLERYKQKLPDSIFMALELIVEAEKGRDIATAREELLRRYISDKEEKIKELQEAKRKAEENGDLEKTDNLKKELQEKEEELKKIKTEYRALSNIAEEVKRLMDQNIEYTNKISNLEKELEAANSLIKKQENAAEEAKKKIDDLAKAKEVYEKERDNYKGLFEKGQEELLKLKEELKLAEGMFKEAQDSLQKSKKELFEKENKYKEEKEGMIKEFGEKEELYNATIKKLEEKVAQQNKEISNKARQVESLEMRVEELKKSLKAIEKDTTENVNKYAQREKELLSQIEGLKAKIAEYEKMKQEEERARKVEVNYADVLGAVAYSVNRVFISKIRKDLERSKTSEIEAKCLREICGNYIKTVHLIPNEKSKDKDRMSKEMGNFKRKLKDFIENYIACKEKEMSVDYFDGFKDEIKSFVERYVKSFSETYTGKDSDKTHVINEIKEFRKGLIEELEDKFQPRKKDCMNTILTPKYYDDRIKESVMEGIIISTLYDMKTDPNKAKGIPKQDRRVIDEFFPVFFDYVLQNISLEEGASEIKAISKARMSNDFIYRIYELMKITDDPRSFAADAETIYQGIIKTEEGRPLFGRKLEPRDIEAVLQLAESSQPDNVIG